MGTRNSWSRGVCVSGRGAAGGCDELLCHSELEGGDVTASWGRWIVTSWDVLEWQRVAWDVEWQRVERGELPTDSVIPRTSSHDVYPDHVDLPGSAGVEEDPRLRASRVERLVIAEQEAVRQSRAVALELFLLKKHAPNWRVFDAHRLRARGKLGANGSGFWDFHHHKEGYTTFYNQGLCEVMGLVLPGRRLDRRNPVTGETLGEGVEYGFEGR